MDELLGYYVDTDDSNKVKQCVPQTNCADANRSAACIQVANAGPHANKYKCSQPMNGWYVHNDESV